MYNTPGLRVFVAQEHREGPAPNIVSCRKGGCIEALCTVVHTTYQCAPQYKLRWSPHPTAPTCQQLRVTDADVNKFFCFIINRRW